MVDIRFLTRNAAFEDDYAGEVRRILLDIAESIAAGGAQGVIFDSNGNRVGDWLAAPQRG